MNDNLVNSKQKNENNWKILRFVLFDVIKYY